MAFTAVLVSLCFYAPAFLPSILVTLRHMHPRIKLPPGWHVEASDVAADGSACTSAPSLHAIAMFVAQTTAFSIQTHNSVA